MNGLFRVSRPEDRKLRLVSTLAVLVILSFSNQVFVYAGGVSLVTVVRQEDDRSRAERLSTEAEQLNSAGSAMAGQLLDKAGAAGSLWAQLGERKRQARMLHLTGNACTHLGRYDQAKLSYGQALEMRRELADRTGERETLGELGWVSFLLSENDRALEYFSGSLSISRDLGDRRAEGDTLNDLGNVYFRRGDYEKALEHYRPALIARREVKNRAGEGSTLSNLANIYYSLNQYENALEHYRQALEIRREVSDRHGEADTLNNLGNVYYRLGRYDRAIEHYSPALEIYRTLKSRAREGSVLNNLGEAGLQLGRYDSAVEYYQQALGIRRELKDLYGEAFTLNNLGESNRYLGRYDASIEYLNQALAIRREIRDRAGEAETLNNLGRVRRLQNHPEQAIDYQEQALQVAREIRDRITEAAASSELMLAWATRNNPAAATFYGKNAVNLYQQIRSEIVNIDRESRQSFVRSKENTYRDLADLLIAQGRLPEAEQVLGLLKEEEYFEFIRRDRAAAPEAGRAEMTPAESSIEKRFKAIADEIAGIGAERGILLDKSSRTPEEENRLAKLESDLIVAGQAFQQFLDRLERELSDSVDATGKVYQLRESQGLMEDLRDLGPGVVALYTLITDDKLRVILTTPDLQKGYEYPIRRGELSRKIYAFREVVQNPKLDPLPPAQELYRIIVGPVANDLKAIRARTLMWSLDGVLRYLPLPALHDGRQYLVENFRNVVFTPASKARLKDVPSGRWRALGLGVTRSTDERIPALPGVREEIQGIIREENPENATGGAGILPGIIKLDEDFTQAAMISSLRQRRPVVHIASHFLFRPGNETDSALLLGDGSFLNLAEIKNLPNVFGGVELLTLSACNTATGGTDAGGREIEGFGVLAQRQGAKAVIATLWPVADRSTKYLMQEFYRLREANTGAAKAEALRLAQIELLNGSAKPDSESPSPTREIVHEESKSGEDKRPKFKRDPDKPYAHPYFWAPFILIGNWR